MSRRRNSRDNNFYGGFKQMTPRQQEIFGNIHENFDKGLITKAEAYRQFEYFGIVVIHASEIPY